MAHHRHDSLEKVLAGHTEALRILHDQLKHVPPHRAHEVLMSVKDDLTALVAQATNIQEAVPAALSAAYQKGLDDSEADLAPVTSSLSSALSGISSSLSAGVSSSLSGVSSSLPSGVSTGVSSSLSTAAEPLAFADVAGLPNPSLSVPYSATLETTGGAPPATFAVTSGALPDGLNLDSAGNITGTPTAAGAFSFGVTATDAAGATASQDFSVSVS